MTVLACAPPVWVLDDAVAFVREIQPALHALRWHVALGGGVLNKGESGKDADLYVLPFNDDADIMPTLKELWGESESIGYGSPSIYEHKVKFSVSGGKRIDVFVGRRGCANA